MTYEYYTYGYKLYSNTLFHMLIPYKNQNYIGEINLFIEINNNKIDYVNNWEITIKSTENIDYLYLGKNVLYCLDHVNNKIKACASDINIIESTILNLPFALFFIKKNMLILHSSCLISNNNLIPFCAPKGIGKTTISCALSNFYNFFSDDTILVNYVDNEFIGYASTNCVKLTQDSFQLLELKGNFELLKKNIQNKVYYNMRQQSINDNTNNYNIHNLYFLHRDTNINVNYEYISNDFYRKLILHSNICGTSVLGYEYCKLVEKNIVFQQMLENCDFIKITIPNDKDNFLNSVVELKNILCNNYEVKM